MVKVSIIIPIYNAQKYLQSCLESVVNQTLQDIEIICVNDGSTDKSLDILNRFAQNDDRICVIDKQNEGVSVARNIGIEKAKGEFIMFLDADDTFFNNACEVAYNSVISDGAEIGIFGHKLRKKRRRITPTVIASSSTYLGYINVWNKIFKTSFINDNNIRFPIGIKTAEDIVFSYMTYFNNPKISFINEYLILYRCHFHSNTSARFMNEIKSDVEAIEYFINTEIFQSQPFENKLKVIEMFSDIISWLATKAKTKEDITNRNLYLKRYCELVESQISTEDLSGILSYAICKNPPKRRNFLKKIFSISYSANRKSKIICIFGIKFRIKNK